MYLPYISADKQTVLGHYAVAQLSGAIAATPTALDVHASIRWAPTLSNTLCVPLRIKVGWACITAVTTAVRMAYQGSIVRQFTSDFTTAATAINMATVAKSGAMRSSMYPSQMGATGPRICTTAPQTTYTGTLDNAPFGITVWSNPGILTGTASLVAGVAGNMQTLYERTADGQHPIVLANNEGIVIQLVHTGWASGTISLYMQWEWAECLII